MIKINTIVNDVQATYLDLDAVNSLCIPMQSSRTKGNVNSSDSLIDQTCMCPGMICLMRSRLFANRYRFFSLQDSSEKLESWVLGQKNEKC